MEGSGGRIPPLTEVRGTLRPRAWNGGIIFPTASLFLAIAVFATATFLLPVDAGPAARRQCPCREQCPVKIQKKKALLQFNQSALLAAETRKELANGECRRQNTSKRAAIEGTISAIKRGRGATKLAVRDQVKCALVIGLKCIAHNFQQLKSWFQVKAKEAKEISVKPKMPLQGVSVPV